MDERHYVNTEYVVYYALNRNARRLSIQTAHSDLEFVDVHMFDASPENRKEYNIRMKKDNSPTLFYIDLTPDIPSWSAIYFTFTFKRQGMEQVEHPFRVNWPNYFRWWWDHMSNTNLFIQDTYVQPGFMRFICGQNAEQIEYNKIKHIIVHYGLVYEKTGAKEPQEQFDRYMKTITPDELPENCEVCSQEATANIFDLVVPEFDIQPEQTVSYFFTYELEDGSAFNTQWLQLYVEGIWIGTLSVSNQNVLNLTINVGPSYAFDDVELEWINCIYSINESEPVEENMILDSTSPDLSQRYLLPIDYEFKLGDRITMRFRYVIKGFSTEYLSSETQRTVLMRRDTLFI